MEEPRTLVAPWTPACSRSRAGCTRSFRKPTPSLPLPSKCPSESVPVTSVVVKQAFSVVPLGCFRATPMEGATEIAARSYALTILSQPKLPASREVSPPLPLQGFVSTLRLWPLSTATKRVVSLRKQEASPIMPSAELSAIHRQPRRTFLLNEGVMAFYFVIDQRESRQKSWYLPDTQCPLARKVCSKVTVHPKKQPLPSRRIRLCTNSTSYMNLMNRQ